MNPFAVATIALATVATAAAQDSHSHSSECTAESLTSARNACDSVADVSQIKCDNEACHEALHSLVEDEVRQCYVDLGLGPVTDLDYYVLLDEFCHGDGADPAGQAATGSTAGTNSTSSGTGGTAVGDHDHDHDDHSHDHDHDHSSDDHDESASSSSSSSSASTIAQSLVALQLVAAAVVTLLM
ncbi:hypothetical protein JG687_00008477 [Phytophthora cactorum]|uniref:Elicitin n=1 Tax=Phytophthora cactorum TaxID=29920 RepID=A0A329SFE3_9STRA|nr:hypothetical protein Pcac1_g7527 [Phytophthora cactorum]KAG2814749.1 hypothetical protein PC112_g14191 [Phytophthora cactorum]KAG2816200.1 hypothetical protein PC111_g13245 [Phytophthora cactorum]KAG2854603.1 hypothetical protein PC113_g13165 [Phytophthora cactorum]KAG2888037.1 hypothetical protein PC114_g18556 [Phytophthora cactorum]